MRCSTLGLIALGLACGDDGSGGSASGESSSGATGDSAAASGTSGGATGTAADTTTGGGSESSGQASTGASGACREPGPPDAARRVVVSHPFDAQSMPSNQWEVVDLSPDGELAFTGTTFEMGRASLNEVAFTPDGRVGVVAQEDGTVGVFQFDDAGDPQVVDPGFAGAFYAGAVVMDASGERAWVLDQQFRRNGGGIYELAIDCDDATPTDVGLVAPAQLPYGMALVDSGRVLVGARDILDRPQAGNDAFLLDWIATPPTPLGVVDAFGDDDWILSSVAVTHDQRYGLLADNSAFSGLPNRIAVVEVGAAALTATQVVSPIEDPIDLVVSPFDDAVIAVSGFGDALFIYRYTPGAAAPLVLQGELEYVGGAPQLPAKAVAVERGDLEGLALVAENTAIRRVRFDGGGLVTDLGPTSAGEGVAAIVGAIGVQP